MKHHTEEKGQALILIALAVVGLFGFAALAIDGSRVYSDKRHAQNAADTAALAAALAYQRGNDIDLAAMSRARSNGYDGGAKSDVTITIADIAAGSNICPGNTAGKDITVTIKSYLETTFARVIGRNEVTSVVSATTRSCGFYRAPLLNKNVIVGLNTSTTDTCPVDSGNGDWYITGGGVFANGCASAHKDFELDDGKCLTSVGNTAGITGECLQHSPRLPYPAAALDLMPPNPCDHTEGDIGITAPTGTTTFTNGVYCISDLDALDMETIVLNNATLYVTDTNFRLMFTGQGGFSGTATRAETFAGSDDFAGYFMVIAIHDPPCTDFNHGDQALLIRGNSGESITGAILAPSACLDLRGTSDGTAMNSQIIGYTVTSNGAATLRVNYNVDDNPKKPVYPSITMLK